MKTREMEIRESQHSFLSFYNHVIIDINKNLNKYLSQLQSVSVFINKNWLSNAIESNNLLLRKVTNARDTNNIWSIAIWKGNEGTIFGRQAHCKLIYMKGTVDQIHNYLETNLTDEEEISYISLLDSPPTLVTL